MQEGTSGGGAVLFHPEGSGYMGMSTVKNSPSYIFTSAGLFFILYVD